MPRLHLFREKPTRAEINSEYEWLNRQFRELIDAGLYYPHNADCKQKYSTALTRLSWLEEILRNEKLEEVRKTPAKNRGKYHE